MLICHILLCMWALLWPSSRLILDQFYIFWFWHLNLYIHRLFAYTFSYFLFLNWSFHRKFVNAFSNLLLFDLSLHGRFLDIYSDLLIFEWSLYNRFSYTFSYIWRFLRRFVRRRGFKPWIPSFRYFDVFLND